MRVECLILIGITLLFSPQSFGEEPNENAEMVNTQGATSAAEKVPETVAEGAKSSVSNQGDHARTAESQYERTAGKDAVAAPILRIQQIRPEALYQPGGGKKDLELAYFVIPEEKVDVIDTSSGAKLGEVKQSGNGLGIAFGYGFSPDSAIRIKLTQSTQKEEIVSIVGSSVTLKNSGLHDISVAGQYVVATPTTNYYIAAEWQGTTEKHKAATASSEGNNQSGGFSITPRFAVSSTVAPNFTLGSYIAYVIRGKRVTDNNSSPSKDYTSKGGNILVARGLIELQGKMATFTANAGFDKRESSEDNITGAFISSPGRTDTTFEVGSRVPINELASLIFSGQMIFVPEQELDSDLKVSSYAQTDISASVRFEF